MGYVGNRMSERAYLAHCSGEKTWSEWRKDDFIELFNEELRQLARKLTLRELKRELLFCTGWHHTGKFYNVTKFYEVCDEYLQELTAKKIEEIIANRPKKEKKQNIKPLFVTAKIKYVDWVGRFARHKKPVQYIEIVQFMSTDKIISVDNGYKKKRISSIEILEKIEQKTKFADKKRLR